jgi:hypothetical protein
MGREKGHDEMTFIRILNKWILLGIRVSAARPFRLMAIIVDSVLHC